MKSYIFTAIIFLSVAQQKCGKNMTAAIPACIQAKIEVIKMQRRWNPPASVDEYNYNGKRVFLFSADCCDQYHQAFDEACNYVCSPTGGMTGKGDQKCTDFKENAVFVRQVWKDER